MKRIIFIKNMLWLALLPALFIAACKPGGKSEERNVQKLQTFTCPMHPQIIKNEMGTCPVCGMDLVPFEKNSSEKSLKVNARSQQLANISTMAIGGSHLQGAKQLNGRLVVNPGQSSEVSSRVAGRITQLYVRETGVQVNKGQALYQLYAEELATLQQEYLMAVAQEKQFPGEKIERQIVASAKQKLLLYGQSEQQLQRLLKGQKKDPYVVFYAPEAGVVAEVAVTEGQYVSAGSPILRLEGYQQLWVEADVYPEELKNIKEGQKAKVVVAGWEDQPQEMTVSFIAPALQAGSQLTQIRGAIPNPGRQWQPGLQANVFLSTGNKSMVLTLPVDAVIRTGKGKLVWIKTGKDTFEFRLVKTGKENDSQVELLEGIKNGDEVVVTGAYLLYSEYILKKGKNPF